MSQKSTTQGEKNAASREGVASGSRFLPRKIDQELDVGRWRYYNTTVKHSTSKLEIAMIACQLSLASLATSDHRQSYLIDEYHLIANLKDKLASVNASKKLVAVLREMHKELHFLVTAIFEKTIPLDKEIAVYRCAHVHFTNIFVKYMKKLTKKQLRELIEHWPMQRDKKDFFEAIAGCVKCKSTAES